jgi:hypothetical protein
MMPLTPEEELLAAPRGDPEDTIIRYVLGVKYGTGERRHGLVVIHTSGKTVTGHFDPVIDAILVRTAVDQAAGKATDPADIRQVLDWEDVQLQIHADESGGGQSHTWAPVRIFIDVPF